MRILALVTEAFGGRGGIAQYNRDLLLALDAADPRPEVMVLPRYAPDAPDNLPAGLAQAPPRPGKAAYSLAALAEGRRLKPDVVFCGHLFASPLARIVARLTGAKLVLQLHGIEIWTPPSRAMIAALDAADLVLCVSRDTRRRLLQYSRIAPERAVVLPNTVEARFAPGDREAARARFGLASETAILSVSRLDPRERYKGHDRAIAALPEVAAKVPGIVYLIAGEGDDRAGIEDLARNAGMADRVRFLGHVPADDLPDLYRAADAFVLPSTGEGFGIVFLEAMASGTPAVGLDAGGAADALGEYALTADIGREALAKAILKAATGKLDRKALAAGVSARFGREAFDARVAAVWKRLAA